MSNQKVFIIGGGGMVGASSAYALALREVMQDIRLIDINEQLVWGQVADINDATAFSDSVSVSAGSYDEIENDDIVVITCGAPQQPGQTRMELLAINTSIVKDVIQNITSGGRQPYIVLVSNPVDVLTYVAIQESGLDKTKVFGTGTMLDTARLKVALAEKVNVSSDDVEAYVLGEHGDSSLCALSGARIGDISLNHYEGLTNDYLKGLDAEIRERAYKIIEAKKSTYFAIGRVVSEVVTALRQETPSIYPLSSYVEGQYGLTGVTISLPCMLSNQGVKIIEGYELNDAERKALDHSATIIKEAIDTIR